MGRLLAALAKESPSGAPPHRVKSYSIAGNTKILEGFEAPSIVSSSGPVRLNRLDAVRAELEDMTRNESDSVFGETYAQMVESAVGGAEGLHTYIHMHIHMHMHMHMHLHLHLHLHMHVHRWAAPRICKPTYRRQSPPSQTTAGQQIASPLSSRWLQTSSPHAASRSPSATYST